MESRFFPVPVVGGLRFREVSVGQDHSCGVTLNNGVYCWGWNGEGQVGDGTLVNRSKPVRVGTFTQVRAGPIHTCAINLLQNAYCWGSNAFGQLGIGTQGGRHTKPVKVLSGLHWR